MHSVAYYKICQKYICSDHSTVLVDRTTFNADILLENAGFISVKTAEFSRETQLNSCMNTKCCEDTSSIT